ncbi:sigma-70 family RNA polymerase sigma factor [Marivita sp. GX14005]|uniref:RNA polymerase sigma factor n=1 Tax=Marivita sp. GX14005 TaxID=2942276 RepID=UPI0020198AB2|nr:sigma-70 family RNA polymerase sigma factor [Marivita sp. GX14005]MCL3883581.1 sigma-70 family RNA polymerase sigma factor [Marivita sp. GX14005]
MDTQDHTRLLARARRLTRSPQDAEDLCHEVYLAVLEREKAGGRIDRPLPYMMTALRHAAQARARASAREAPLGEEDGPQVEDAALSCLCSEVLAHVERLSLTDRTLLRRVAIDGLTPSELAAELKLPVGTVMSRLARARVRLRAALGIETLFAS